MKIQKGLVIPIVCFLVASTASNADTAVSQTNMQVVASYGKADFPGSVSDSKSFSGHVGLQIPIGSVFGASLEGVLGQTELGDIYEYDYNLYLASIFARSSKLGMLGIGVGGTEIKTDALPGDTSNTDYQAIAAGYLGPVTLAFTRTRTDNNDTSATGDDSWADVTWYIVPNFLINVSAGFMDAKDTYMVALEHQIGNSGFSYGLSHGWNNNTDGKDYYVVVSYRFGKSKSLQQRYRSDLYSTR